MGNKVSVETKTFPDSCDDIECKQKQYYSLIYTLKQKLDFRFPLNFI